MADYYEIIIRGDANVVDAYLKGFLAGRGIKSGFFFSREWPFHLKHVWERLKYRGEVEHVVCVAGLRQTISGSIDRSNVDIEVKEMRKIESMSFHFDFKTANRKAGAAIKRALRSLPPGVAIEDLDPVESVRPDARGAEGYAPLHDYEFEGKGVVTGDVDGVLKMHKRLSGNDSFRVEDIDIHA